MNFDIIDWFGFHQVRLVISADVRLEHLFHDASEQDNDNDDNRKLMDDLGISSKSEGGKASIFTGEEELFAFQRTLSRLSEMQTQEYWDSWEQGGR